MSNKMSTFINIICLFVYIIELYRYMFRLYSVYTIHLYMQQVFSDLSVFIALFSCVFNFLIIEKFKLTNFS